MLHRLCRLAAEPSQKRRRRDEFLFLAANRVTVCLSANVVYRRNRRTTTSIGGLPTGAPLESLAGADHSCRR